MTWFWDRWLPLTEFYADCTLIGYKHLRFWGVGRGHWMICVFKAEP